MWPGSSRASLDAAVSDKISRGLAFGTCQGDN
jgi:hypothetical protein